MNPASGKFQIPKTKLQKNPKLQLQKASPHSLSFEVWDFIGIWNLGFGVWWFRKPAFAVVLVFALLSACSTSSRTDSASKASPTFLLVRAPDSTTQRLAQAHAHYAAG